jgi:hypothetical protein
MWNRGASGGLPAINATHLGGIQEANNTLEQTASQPNGLQVKASAFGGWLAVAHRSICLAFNLSGKL